MKVSYLRERFEQVYARYNKASFIHPDPLEFLYRYPDPLDREIVALLASSLAYGRVKQILKAVSSVLARMPSPSRFLEKASTAELLDTFEDFRYRFTSGQDMVRLLSGATRALDEFGSLEACFCAGFCPGDDTVIPALSRFVVRVYPSSRGKSSFLLPDPRNGSACKRAFLFLRWMVRKDLVDPGGWRCITPSKLLIPLDTHMFHISRELGFTDRKQADLKSALEITRHFREISPRDPVKYDFVITRFGIRPDMDPSMLMSDSLFIVRDRPS
ncbi:MAG: TIGR02757 family protein [Nitrospiraceae bacterium]|nr:TIGR02757 family protein [Nitrospiraceae bacterium]